MYHLLKMFGKFDELSEFAYWWSCVGKGLQSMGLPHLFFIFFMFRQIREDYDSMTEHMTTLFEDKPLVKPDNVIIR